MTNYRKYSEAWHSRAVERLEEIKEELKEQDLDMFDRYKLYGEELELIKDVSDYELSKIDKKYTPMELRV
jgi:hypothetical protein